MPAAVMSSPIHSPVKKLIMTGLSSPSSPLNSPKMPSSPLLFSTSHPHTGTTPSPSSSPLNSPNVVSSPLSFRPPTPPSPFSSPMKSPRMISSPLSSGSALTRSPAPNSSSSSSSSPSSSYLTSTFEQLMKTYHDPAERSTKKYQVVQAMKKKHQMQGFAFQLLTCKEVLSCDGMYSHTSPELSFSYVVHVGTLLLADTLLLKTSLEVVRVGDTYNGKVHN